jgi:hypothetical protein
VKKVSVGARVRENRKRKEERKMGQGKPNIEEAP